VTVTIEYISWLINVTDVNDARWKPKIKLKVVVFLESNYTN